MSVYTQYKNILFMMAYNIMYKYMIPRTTLTATARKVRFPGIAGTCLAKYKKIFRARNIITYRMAFPLFYLLRPAAYIIIYGQRGARRAMGRVRIKDFMAQ